MLLKKGGTQQLVIAVPYLDTHDVQGVPFNSPPKIVALNNLDWDKKLRMYELMLYICSCFLIPS